MIYVARISREPLIHISFTGRVLVWFYGISIIFGYFMPNDHYTYQQFYFKQFSLA